MKNAWIVSFIRLPMLLAVLLLLAIFLHLFGLTFDLTFLPYLSTFYFTIVNILCLFLLYYLAKKEGNSVKKWIDFRSDHLRKDLLYGILWLFVLYIPFIFAILGMMFVLYGTDLFIHFQTVFTGDLEHSTLSLPKWFMWITAGISSIFPFLNAPIEELMYRGYAQTLFHKHYRKAWISIVIPSSGFALQHIMLAASLQGAVVYAAAFFLWGIGSGIIYHIQKRLFPLIICHFLVNLIFGLLPMVFMFLEI